MKMSHPYRNISSIVLIIDSPPVYSTFKTNTPRNSKRFITKKMDKIVQGEHTHGHSLQKPNQKHPQHQQRSILFTTSPKTYMKFEFHPSK